MWHPESIYDAAGHLDEGVVHAWLDGQLAPEPAASVEQHAAACTVCSAMVAEARGLIAGASRVMSALDEPVAGTTPGRDPMIGIVAGAGTGAGAGRGGGGGRTPSHRSLASDRAQGVRRWTMRRVSLAAAAALMFVAATLVLRDGGSVREMVQADHSVLEAPAGRESASLPDAAAVPEAGVAGEHQPRLTSDAPRAAAAAGSPVVASPPAASRADSPTSGGAGSVTAGGGQVRGLVTGGSDAERTGATEESRAAKAMAGSAFQAQSATAAARRDAGSANPVRDAAPAAAPGTMMIAPSAVPSVEVQEGRGGAIPRGGECLCPAACSCPAAAGTTGARSPGAAPGSGLRKSGAVALHRSAA